MSIDQHVRGIREALAEPIGTVHGFVDINSRNAVLAEHAEELADLLENVSELPEFDLDNPPWAADEYGGLSEKWGDEQDRSEWYEAAASYWCALAAERGVMEGKRYRARMQDRLGDRWSVIGPLAFLERHAEAQRLEIIWIRPL